MLEEEKKEELLALLTGKKYRELQWRPMEASRQWENGLFL